jgi:hypothetical protein
MFSGTTYQITINNEEKSQFLDDAEADMCGKIAESHMRVQSRIVKNVMKTQEMLIVGSEGVNFQDNGHCPMNESGSGYLKI